VKYCSFSEIGIGRCIKGKDDVECERTCKNTMEMTWKLVKQLLHNRKGQGLLEKVNP
jgi:hypothetical protein